MIHPDEWQPADGLVLEPNALRAATEKNECLALTAGPGAGKTEMLAQRADFLLRTGVCRYPRRILAISFKVDASTNLKERVCRRCGRDLASRFDSHTFHAFAKRIIDRFRPVLTGLDALDPDYTIGTKRVDRIQITFEDMVPLAVQILETSVVARNAIRMSYTDVFLDEFQDCTNEQYKLIKAAFLGTAIRLVAVGDTKQKIMSWAGALEGVFGNFAHDFQAIPLNIYSNYRSKPRLRRLQNEMIKVMDPDAAIPDNQLEGDGGILTVIDYPDCQAEANDIADQISNFINSEETPLSEIAVLMRQQLSQYGAALMEALRVRGIPYRNEHDLQDLTDQPLTKVVIDFLTVIHNNHAPEAWHRLMGVVVEFFDLDHPNSQEKDWSRYIATVSQALRSKDDYSTNMKMSLDLAKTFLKDFGMDRVRALSPEYENRARFKEIWKEICQRLTELSGVASSINEALSTLNDEEVVRILTVHKSKGLEFHTVIFMGIEAETFWASNPSGFEENRSVFFVGVSRAKERLILTHTAFRKKPQGARYWL
ncbi:MAG: DNA helicase UvrD [Desulfobacteraceae bacterium 4572_35.1]|nr:MAG: DNA helicase UvrD [Desulfobacteraceae bacterium 4572_35.1]